jgi:hypothetical protein
MNISLLLIIALALLLFLNFKLRFMVSDPTELYLSKTSELRNKIGSIINDPDYQILINSVPGQKNYSIKGDPPTLTPFIIEGDISKVETLREDFFSLRKDTDELIDALNNYISIAKESQGVYTPEKLDAFLVYYNNMLNNIILIKKYLEK